MMKSRHIHGTNKAGSLFAYDTCAYEDGHMSIGNQPALLGLNTSHSPQTSSHRTLQSSYDRWVVGKIP